MARYGEFYYGMAYYGQDMPVLVMSVSEASAPIEGAYGPQGPAFTRPLDAEVVHRLLDIDGNPYEVTDIDGNSTGLLVVGGSTVGRYGEIPRMSGKVALADPERQLSKLIPKGTIVMLEKLMTFPDGSTYGWNTGRLGVVAPHTPESYAVDSVTQGFEIELLQQAEIALDFMVSGNLAELALPVAQAIGLVSHEGRYASVEAIMAYLLVEGGASAVGIEGTITPTPPYSARFGDKYIIPWIITPELAAKRVMKELVKHTGVTYWIDWDGTAVLSPLPRSVMDITQQAPKRTISETDPNNAVMTSMDPSPGITHQQLALLNQSSTGSVRIIRYAMPSGSSIPVVNVGIGNIVKGQYIRFDSSAFPPPAEDPNDKQDERAKQYALLEMLKGNEVRLSIAPDPWLREGNTVIMEFPSQEIEGLYLVKEKVDDWGMGEDQLLAQRLFTPDGPSDDGTYVWGDQVPWLEVGTWCAFVTDMIMGPSRPDLYNVVPATYEGWLRFNTWQKLAGNNIGTLLFHTTNVDVYVYGGTGATMNCEVRVYNDSYVLVSTLTPFTFTNNDDQWYHWALQREAGWVGLWIDGVLKASASGSFGVVAPPIGGYSAHQGWNTVGIMGLPIGANSITPDFTGKFAAYSWRFTRQAVYPHTNFAPLVADFRAYSYSSYPTILSIWPFLALQEIPISASDPTKVITAWSSVSNLYAYVFGLRPTAGAIAPPFP
jgi:hypothetical protein